LKVFLGVGANLGDPMATILQAWKLVRALSKVSDLQSSHYYLTTPVSSIPQPDYINSVWSLSTDYSLCDLLKELQNVEKSLGKVIKHKDAPRTIDLDILLYGREEMTTEELQVPHPSWKERPFVLVPLSDLTEKVFLPRGKEIAISELLNGLSLNGVKKIHDRSIVWKQ